MAGMLNPDESLNMPNIIYYLLYFICVEKCTSFFLVVVEQKYVSEYFTPVVFVHNQCRVVE